MKKKLITSIFIFVFILILTKSIFAVTIVLDPGHGGRDSGAINEKLGLYERNQVWKIANYLKGYLEEYVDTKVILTCPTLVTTGEVISKEDRAEIMKKNNADLAISIHIDSSTSSKLYGATAYITNLPKLKPETEKFSNILLKNLTKLGISSNGIKTRKTESNDGYYDDGTPLDYYGIIRHPTLAGIPIVLLEHCFISNTNDCKFIDSDEDLKKIARADCDSFVEYLGLKLPSEIKPNLKITNPPKYTLVGSNYKLTLDVSPTPQSENEIKWESSDSKIIKVTEKGLLVPLKEGTSEIKVSYENQKLSDEFTVTVFDIRNDSKIEINKYSLNEHIISKIGPNVLINDFLKNVELSDNLKAEIMAAGDNKIVGTNSKLIVYEKEHNIKYKEYDCIIYGDVNGDGEIDAVDYTLIKNDIMDVKKIKDNNMKLSADVNGDGEMDAVDYTLIKNDIMEVKKITLR